MERFLLFVALGVSLSFGQGAPAAGTLTGTVTDGTTKAGVRKATVYASAIRSTGGQGAVGRFQPPTIYSATTDESGAFRLTGLPAGEYSVRAEKSGFLPKVAAKQAVATVTAGAEAAVGELVLLKHAVIGGKVVDSEGEPVEHVNVQAIPARRGRVMSGMTSGAAVTDDRGEFRIPRLPAGTYKLLATRALNAFATPNAPAAGEQHMVDAPTYFPSAIEATAASEVTVGNGDERSGVDIRLQRTPAVRVSGRVTGEAGTENPVTVMLQSVGPVQAGPMRAFGNALMSRSAVAGFDGRFSIMNVTPGEYVVTAGVYKVGTSLSGLARVRVGQQDVDGVNLALQPLARVTGRAVAEGGGKLPAGQINVSLRPVEPGVPGGGGGGVKADGTFVIEGVQRTRVAVNALAPRGWYLKAVTVGGQRQADFEIDLTGGEAPVELIYSNKPGTVSGTVEGTVEPGVRAMALPDGGAAGPVFTNLYKSGAVAAGQNSFKIEDVPPGNYLIIVCDPALVESLTDPALWEKVKGKAASVKVEEGGTVVAAPRLMSESDLDDK